MTVKRGRFVVRRDGVIVDGEGSWSLGPATSSAGVAGAQGSMTWHRAPAIVATDRDWTQDQFDGKTVEISWVDPDGEVPVFTGTVDSTTGTSLQDPTSQLTDGTLRLTRSLDLRPVASVLPVHPDRAESGGQQRRVGLHATFFTHQAMTVGGFDPGVPMHWSSVWHQNMCGSIAPVPDKDHAYATLGDLRDAYRLSDVNQVPVFLQGDRQIVAADVYAFGVTTPPKPSTSGGTHTGNLGWQITVDMGEQAIDPTYGSSGEILIRNPATNEGLELWWTDTQMLVRRHNSGGSKVTLGTYNRATGGIRDERWSVSWLPGGGLVVRAARYQGNVWTARILDTISTSGITLPTGEDSLCTVRVMSPGVIGVVNVSRGDRTYMTSDEPLGRIYRHTMAGTGLWGWPSMPDQMAEVVLANEARAQVGMRGLPLLTWIDHDGHLISTDFESLAGRDVPADGHHVFDVRPGSGALALDRLTYSTAPGTAFSAVEVAYTRMAVTRRSRASLLLATGKSQTLMTGDTYEDFLHPATGETWLEPDLRPLLAGSPYPSPPYPPDFGQNLNLEVKSWVGGHLIFEESGGTRGWWKPQHAGWTVNAAGYAVGAMERLDPDTVLVAGTMALPGGHLASSMPNPDSRGLREHRKSMALPQLRGFGLMTEHQEKVRTDVAGLDSRHGPYRHESGLWVQLRSHAERVASSLHDAITNPTPTRTAQVEVTGRVHVGDKVLLRERRGDGVVIEEDVVVLKMNGQTLSDDDSMTLEGVVTRRLVTGANGIPGDEEEWDTPPPDVPADDPPVIVPPVEDGDPPSGEEPPLTPPAKPSAPTVTYEPVGQFSGFVVGYDSKTATGADLPDSYAYTEVAIEEDEPSPTTVRGVMWPLVGGGQSFAWTPEDGPPPEGTQWSVRIRNVDRWGTLGAWSDQVGVTVGGIIPWDDIEDLIDNVVGQEVALLDGKVTISPDAPTPADGVGKPDLALWTQFDGTNLLGTWIWQQNPFTSEWEWVEREPQIQHIDLGTFGDLHGARIVAQTILAHHLAVGDFTNHLDNPLPNLTDGQALGWSGHDASPALANPAGGDGVLQVTANGTTKFVTNRMEPCKPGDAIRVEGQFRRTNTGAGAGSVTVGVDVYDANGGHVGLYGIATISRIAMSPNNTWHTISGDGVIPAGGVSHRLVWWVNSAYTSGTVQGCGFELRTKTGTVLIADGAVTADQVAALAIKAQHLESALVLASRVIAGAADGARVEMNPNGLEVWRLAEGGDPYLLTNLSGTGAQTVGVMNAAGDVVAGMTQDGDVSGRAGDLATLALGGTDLLGTLAMAPDQITWSADESLATPLGWADLLSHNSPGTLVWSTATASLSGSEQPWFEFSAEFVAGRVYLLTGDFRLDTGSSANLHLRLRKEELDLPTVTPVPPPTTSSDMFGSAKSIRSATSGGTNHTFFWSFTPTRSEAARFLVTLDGDGSFAGVSAVIGFADVSHRNRRSLVGLDRRIAQVPTPPTTPPKRTYTSRWYATQVVCYQGGVVSQPSRGAHVAGQGRNSKMSGDPRRAYLRFDNATAISGETGKTLDQALNGATVISRKLRANNLWSSFPAGVAPVIGRATSAGGTVTAITTGTVVPRGGQRTSTIGDALTAAHMRAAGFRIVLGPGSSTPDVSYADFGGTGPTDGSRVLLEVTYER